MMDETFIFLGQPYIGNAYRQTNSPVKQYCKISEIISFVTDSINNNTLNKGIKYKNKNYIRFKYEFVKGSNKQSVSVIINENDYQLYATEMNTLNQELRQEGFVKKYNLLKIKELLNNPLALLTFTNEVLIKNNEISIS